LKSCGKGNAITLISAQKKRMVMNIELKRTTAALRSSRSNVESEKRVARVYIYLTIATLFVDGCHAISTTVSLPVEKAGANGRS
jgi:hypothetical protein